MHGGGGRVPGVDWIAGLAVTGQPLRRGREVVRRARVGGGDVLPEQPRRTAWPEHQADPEADSEADRDVLDTDEPDLPADRLDDVEQDQDDDCERGLPGRERDHPRSVGGRPTPLSRAARDTGKPWA